VLGCFEHGSELSGSIEGGKFLDHLGDVPVMLGCPRGLHRLSGFFCYLTKFFQLQCL
jgi:hypothetical protein